MTTINTPHADRLRSYHYGIARTAETSVESIAANAALLAGVQSVEEARAAWGNVKAVVNMGHEDVPAADSVARRTANVAVRLADRTLGLVSNFACGLWVVTSTGKVAEVHSTSHGADYLDAIVFDGEDRLQDWPVGECLAFLDSKEEAYSFLRFASEVAARS